MTLLPQTLRGYVVVLVAIAALAIAVFATTMPGIALGLVIIGAAGVALYYLAFRTDRWLKGEGF